MHVLLGECFLDLSFTMSAHWQLVCAASGVQRIKR